MKLFPAIVTLHLLGALVLLVLLTRLALAYRGEAQVGVVLPRKLRQAVQWAFGVLVVQTALGAWVSTNQAVLACPEFPSCLNGVWWPANLAWAEGFEWWRPLGQRSDGAWIGMPALLAIHMAHRVGALLTLGVLGGVGYALWCQGRRADQAVLRRWAVAWLGLLGLQVLTGVSNVVLQWPLPAAMLHTGGAAALWVCLTWVLGASGKARASDVQGVAASISPMGLEPRT